MIYNKKNAYNWFWKLQASKERCSDVCTRLGLSITVASLRRTSPSSPADNNKEFVSFSDNKEIKCVTERLLQSHRSYYVWLDKLPYSCIRVNADLQNKYSFKVADVTSMPNFSTGDFEVLYRMIKLF